MSYLLDMLNDLHTKLMEASDLMGEIKYEVIDASESDDVTTKVSNLLDDIQDFMDNHQWDIDDIYSELYEIIERVEDFEK